MSLRQLFLYAALVIAGTSTSQVFNSASDVDHCGFERHHRQLMLNDPDYALRVNDFNTRARTWVDDGLRGGGSLKVPVVVHVMDAGTSISAITDDQIRAGIRWLNERYRKVAGTAGAGNGVDTNIEFALAVRDPNGNCTTGITRYDMSGNATYVASGVFDQSAGITEASLKALRVWPQTQYYNIWLISEFDNNNGGAGLQGYAYFSGSHGNALDGCVMLVNGFKDPSSVTLAHELGHAFNLYHTFEGDANGTTCPGNATCGTQGDLVCDTPPHIRSASNCNSGGTNSCDANSSNSLFVFNYMDYSSCGNMFTAGQSARLTPALTTDRASFLAVNGNMSLVPPGNPSLDIVATKSLLCGVGQTVTLYDWSTCLPNTYLAVSAFPNISYSWTMTNGVNTYNSTAQNPTFTLGSTGVFNATMQVTTPLGTFTRTENGIVVVAASPIAACTPTTSNAGNFAQTISNVSFNTISNATSTINNVAYTDYACTQNTVVPAGSTRQLSVTINAGGSGTEVLRGYIDYNNNGTFEDPSELVISGSTAANTSTTVTANVTIPGGAVANTLLRMRMYGELVDLSATERTCGAALLAGDVEDYGVYVSNAVAAVSIAASPGSTITYGTNVTFTPTPTNGGGAPVYTWLRNGTSVGTGATYQSNNLLPGETIRCSMASNLANVIGSPALSNAITMTVTGAPLSDFTANPVRICSGGSVQFTDASQLIPTSWSWSFPGGSPSTSTAQNPTVTYASAGTYNVTLIASNGNGTGSTMTKTGYITVYAAPTAGCTVTRSTAPAAGIGITNVTVNTINNSTAYDDAVMNDFTCSKITVLDPNTTYNISVTVGAFNNQWVRAYIDYNGNGQFTDSGEQIFAPANGVNVRSGTFTTPVSTQGGLLRRMRVITDFVNTTPGPCATPVQYGQVEEYGVVFTTPANTAPVLNATPNPAMAAINEDAGAPSGAVGTLISALVDLTVPAGGLDNVTDPDAGALTGLAIVTADATNGTWHYSTNGGTNWNALGTPTSTAARLLAADASTRLYFQPNANFNGTISSAITFRAWDRTAGTNGTTADVSVNGATSAYSSATDVASLVITAVNDAPTATNLSAAESYTEDIPLNLVDIVTGDIDNASLTVTLTLSNTSAGTLSTGTSGAVTSTFSAGVWSASGAIANVNTLLAGVVFTPALNFNSNFTIATNVSDGIAAPLTGTKAMTGTAVNDAPTATNNSAGETYQEDTPLNLIDIVVSDVDNAAVTVTLTLSNTAAGSLSTGTSGAVTSTYTAGTGVWSASGALADVNVLLAGVIYTPAFNFNSSFTINTSVSDGIAAAVLGAKSMTGVPVNDPPTASNLSAPETYVEDIALNLVDIVVGDVDNAAVTVTLTLSNTAAGSLSTGTSGAVTSTYTAGTGVWSASGAIANVNTLLAGVVFTPAGNFGSNFTIATSVSDGIAAAVTGSKAMTGTPVNDPPTASNLSAAESYTEDTPLNLIDIVAADVDNASITATLTLSNTAAGSLSTGTSGAVTSTYSSGTGTWSASGAIANVNTLLAGVVFTPASNFNGNFTISTSVSDGIAAALTGSKAMTGTAVNDAPVNSLPAAQSTPQDVPLVLSSGNANALSVADVDAAASSVQITLTATNGTITLSGLTGLTFSVGSGTANATMTFTGTLTNVNNALNGMVFNPTAGFSGAATLTITSNDQGNVGSGGALSDTDVLNITVTQVNVVLALKARLEGPYDNTTGLMSDAVRSAGLIPTTEPYTALGYSYVGSSGGTINAGVLTVTGNDAIVDWVVVELRNNAAPATIVASKCALIQRDGDVVGLDGISPVSITLAAGTYRVALRHRNHLGVMTLNGVGLTGSSTAVDLTSALTATFGTEGQKSITGAFPTQAMWAGDVNFDGSLKYTGSANDRDPILVAIGGSTPNNVVAGYLGVDVNMDGLAKYTGSANDRDPILVNIGGSTPNNVRLQQLP